MHSTPVVLVLLVSVVFVICSALAGSVCSLSVVSEQSKRLLVITVVVIV
jgi:hypothetical protein